MTEAEEGIPMGPQPHLWLESARGLGPLDPYQTPFCKKVSGLPKTFKTGTGRGDPTPEAEGEAPWGPYPIRGRER